MVLVPVEITSNILKVTIEFITAALEPPIIEAAERKIFIIHRGISRKVHLTSRVMNVWRKNMMPIIPVQQADSFRYGGRRITKTELN